MNTGLVRYSHPQFTGIQMVSENQTFKMLEIWTGFRHHSKTKSSKPLPLEYQTCQVLDSRFRCLKSRKVSNLTKYEFLLSDLHRFRCFLIGRGPSRKTIVTNSDRICAPSAFRHGLSKIWARIAKTFAATSAMMDLGLALKFLVATFAQIDFAVGSPVSWCNLKNKIQ